MSNSNHPLEREPNFEELSDRQLLVAAANNAFHNGKTIRSIKIMVTVIGIIVILIVMRLYGVT